MKVVIVPSAAEPASPDHCLSTYLVNDAVSIDAGGLALFGRVADQALVRHVFLTHSHIDHVATLPIFLDNVYQAHPDGVHVYGSPALLASLQQDVFNDRLWPDFVRLSRERVQLEERRPLADGRPVEAAGLRVTPVPVDHVVPTHAFVIESPEAAVAVVTDTRPT